MWFLDIFKKKKPEITVKAVPGDDSMQQLCAKRMAENMPVLTRGPVESPPQMETDRFRFDDVLIGTVMGEYRHYLLDGTNAASFVRDMDEINKYVFQAYKIITDGLPDLTIDRFDTAFQPFPDPAHQNWLYSRMVIESLTPTGEQKKYPLSIVWQTQSRLKSGHFYYDKYGNLGKGTIMAKNPDEGGGIFNYSVDFIGGKLSHIWAHTREGKRALYNKNKP